MKNMDIENINYLLATQWHPSKNGSLTINDLPMGSGKKVWWMCEKGHEWQTRFIDRTNKKRNCPYCCNQKVCKDNCLATTNPKLSKQWHPSKNYQLTPFDVVVGSGKKIWWICDKGHEWESTISNRINKNTGCPYCSGRKVCNDNCLATTNPKLSEQWHPSKNYQLTPFDVVSGSNKKVWWVCDKGHEWEAVINNRKNYFNCPYCINQKVCNDNCLATINPELSKQWNKSKNLLTTKDVVPGSNKKVWWVCDKGHEWEAVIYERAIENLGCPYCSNQKVCNDNCLATINPELTKQWHPSKNYQLTPFDVISGSGKKVWWICDKGHEWEATISHRINGTGCPTCNESKGEITINKYLESNNIYFKTQYKFYDSDIPKYRFDFFTHDGLIEFHGQQHYIPCSFGSKNKNAKIIYFYDVLYRDLKKEIWCKEQKKRLLIIPFWDIENISKIIETFFCKKEPLFSNPPEIVIKHNLLREKILKHIRKSLP